MARMRFLTHAGIHLEMDGVSLLVDPFCIIDEPLWANTPDTVQKALLHGEPPLQKPDLLLITHVHEDHFNLEWTLELLARFPQLVVVAPWPVRQLLLPCLPSGFCGPLLPAGQAFPTGVQALPLLGLTVHIHSTDHDGSPDYATEHFSYLIQGSRSVLVVGDARPSVENWGELNAPVDMLVAPFPYLTLSPARKLVARHIAPGRQVYLHLPNKVGDGEMFRQSIDANMARLKDQNVRASLFQYPVQSIRI